MCILDNGRTFHMTRNKAWLEDFFGGEEGHMLLGNDKSCKILYRGLVRIHMFDGLLRGLL